MNSSFLRYIAALLGVVLLLQFYFVREMAVVEILFALLLIVALVVARTGCLIGYALLLWLERPRPNHAKPHIAWKERSIEPYPYAFYGSLAFARRRFAGRAGADSTGRF